MSTPREVAAALASPAKWPSKRGPKPKPADKKASHQLTVRLLPHQMEMLRAVASLRGESLASALVTSLVRDVASMPPRMAGMVNQLVLLRREMTPSVDLEALIGRDGLKFEGRGNE